MQVAYLLYDRFTALDVTGPYEVFSSVPGIESVIVAEGAGPVRNDRRTLAIAADRSLDEVRSADVVVVPGGFGTRRWLNYEPLIGWLRSVHETTTWTTSVCTGSLLLAAAGLLAGAPAATHWRARETLGSLGAVPASDRVVRHGKIMTAAGVSSGIDMAFRVVQEMFGNEVAQAVQLGIEYDPEPPFDAGSVEKAETPIVEAVTAVFDTLEAEALEAGSSTRLSSWPAVSDDRLSGSGRIERGGYYTAHSEAQEAYGELGFEWLEQAAAEVEPPPAPLPFELLAGSPRTYLGAPGVFALAEGRSFYEPLFPEGLLSLGWSSIAVHWLSGVPTPIPDHIYSTFASGLVREALRERSASDWRAFLTYRARELRTSGRLVVVGGAARDDGMSDAEGLMDMANAALQTMVEDGDLQQAEYARMTIPTWDRTTAEFLEPFDSGEFDGTLELLRHAARSLPDTYFAAYSADRDLDRYVSNVADFFHAAFADSLWAALDQNRDASQREAIGARFDALLRQRIAADPETAACRWHVVVLDIARL